MKQPPARHLSILPIIDSDSLCDTDMELISLVKCPTQVIYLTDNFTLLFQLVKDLHSLLDHMFIASKCSLSFHLLLNKKLLTRLVL